MRRIAVIILCVFLASCSETAWGPIVKMMMDEEMEARVDAITDEVVARDMDAVQSRLSPSISADAARTGLTDLFNHLPEGEPESTMAISYNWRSNTSLNDGQSGSTRSATIVVRLEYETAIAYLTIGLFAAPGDDYSINTLRANTVESGAADSSAYAPERHTIWHAVFGILAFAMPLFIIGSLIAMYRMKRIKRRIIWTLLMLVGYPVFALNWTTGDVWLASPGVTTTANSWHLSLIDIKFFGAAFEQIPGTGMLVWVAVPLGALIFWIKYSTAGITRKPPKETPAPPANTDE
ncbi:hypothetical protein HXX25_07910 [Hyphobacterium sp. CCMP332]|uniref:hypothetical protein n=1 Tax=Hyphobacterium sp. CCMP332 TaxID=2749086 RepID=UPI00164FEDE1|nr:hypothetical protein [Hyphobacterium sp. CCMP332]QNL19242.1 hypothetical protein HXX25_07910 [Hyphobacterium sp. CCMP332]